MREQKEASRSLRRSESSISGGYDRMWLFFFRILVVISRRRGYWRIQPLLRKMRFPSGIVWIFGVPEQLQTWREWIRQGAERSESEFCFRVDPSAHLQSEIGTLLDQMHVNEASILDIGAGPLTSLGKFWKGKRQRIVAIDPLALCYDEILKEHSICPPVRTIPGSAERLKPVFENESFDLIYAENSLDHTRDPIAALEDSFAILRPGGVIYLAHWINEGEREDYSGFHQWNFCSANGSFFIANENAGEVNITELFSGLAEIRTKETRFLEKPWLEVIIRKNQTISNNSLYERSSE